MFCSATVSHHSEGFGYSNQSLFGRLTVVICVFPWTDAVCARGAIFIEVDATCAGELFLFMIVRQNIHAIHFSSILLSTGCEAAQLHSNWFLCYRRASCGKWRANKKRHIQNIVSGKMSINRIDSKQFLTVRGGSANDCKWLQAIIRQHGAVWDAAPLTASSSGTAGTSGRHQA